MSSPTYTSIPLDQFQQEFKDTSTEVSSVALGGRIVSFSDEFFAEAVNLLKVEVSHTRLVTGRLVCMLMSCIAISVVGGPVWAQGRALRWVGDEEA